MLGRPEFLGRPFLVARHILTSDCYYSAGWGFACPSCPLLCLPSHSASDRRRPGILRRRGACNTYTCSSKALILTKVKSSVVTTDLHPIFGDKGGDSAHQRWPALTSAEPASFGASQRSPALVSSLISVRSVVQIHPGPSAESPVRRGFRASRGWAVSID